MKLNLQAASLVALAVFISPVGAQTAQPVENSPAVVAPQAAEPIPEEVLSLIADTRAPNELTVDELKKRARSAKRFAQAKGLPADLHDQLKRISELAQAELEGRQQVDQQKAAGDQAARDQAVADKAANEQAALDNAAAKKAAQEQAAADKAAEEQAAADKAAAKKLAQEQAAANKAAEEQAAADKATAKKAAQEQAAADKAAEEQASADKAAKEQAAADKAAAKKLAQEQAATDKATKDQAAADKVAQDQLAAHKLAATKVAQEQVAAEKALAGKIAKAHADQVAADQLAKDQAAKEQAALDKAAKDQAALDKAAIEQAALDKAAKDQAAADKAAKEQATAEKIAADKLVKKQAADEKALADQVAKAQADQAVAEQLSKDQAAAQKDQQALATKPPVAEVVPSGPTSKPPVGVVAPVAPPVPTPPAKIVLEAPPVDKVVPPPPVPPPELKVLPQVAAAPPSPQLSAAPSAADVKALDSNIVDPVSEKQAQAYLADRSDLTKLSDVDLRKRLDGVRELMTANELAHDTERAVRQKLKIEREVLRQRIAYAEAAQQATQATATNTQPVVPGTASKPSQPPASTTTNIINTTNNTNIITVLTPPQVVLNDRRPAEKLDVSELQIRIPIFGDAQSNNAYDPSYRDYWRASVERDRAILRRRLIDERRRREAELAMQAADDSFEISNEYVQSDRPRRDVFAAEIDPREMEDVLIQPPRQISANPRQRYDVEQISTEPTLRNSISRIEIDTIRFGTNEAFIRDEQVRNLDEIAAIIEKIVKKYPNEVFVIEGHTDAPGSAPYNERLSKLRAESVKSALTSYYVIPEKNLRTVGLGERFLKIPTAEPEPENRRVSIARITPLLAQR